MDYLLKGNSNNHNNSIIRKKKIIRVVFQVGYIYSFRAQVCFELSRYQRVATCRNKWINCPFLYKTRCKQSTKCIMIRPTPHGQPYSTNIHIKVLWLNILLCFFICLKTMTECNRKWVFKLKVNDLNVICILLMQRQSITHEKYFFVYFLCLCISIIRS